ncbi:S-2-hydroxy-acid oxidase, partial [Aureobasidium melanogenum]
MSFQRRPREDVREDPITVTEVAKIAKKNLQTDVWNYYECGADEEQALGRNTRDFDRLFIRPRVMIDVCDVDTSVHLFGKKYPLPIGFAPSAMQKLAGGAGEIDVARAARKLNVNLTLSSQSTCSLEDVMQEAGKGLSLPDLWHQIYLTRDLELSIPLIKRAEAAGYTALVITVDTPVLGNRWNERKTPLVLPSDLRLANIEPPLTLHQSLEMRKPTFNRLLMDARTTEQAKGIIESAGPSMHSSSITWERTLPWLRKVTKLKIILKGIMTAEDALLSIQHGVDGTIVSNHKYPSI